MIDASANIKNAKIEEINGLFRQVLCDPCIKELKDDPYINYSIAVMEYSDDCYWHSSNPIPLNSMEWKIFKFMTVIQILRKYVKSFRKCFQEMDSSQIWIIYAIQ